jgi:NRAMP (natural resistance-associated macrophage protein)-like metal ion transporter
MHGDAPASEAGLMRLLELPHHPHRRLRGYFKRLGPGIVTGAADDDPSGIGTYSQVGAAFGFGLLWTTLATLPLAVAVQEATARLGLVTGKGLAALIRERFARPVLVGAVVLVAVANTFNIGADIGSMAAAAGLLVPVPYVVATVAFALVMVTLELVVPYHRYARVLRWLTVSLLAYVGCCSSSRWTGPTPLPIPLCPDCLPTGPVWWRCGWMWQPGWARGSA